MVYGIEVIKIMCSLNKIKLCPKVGDIYTRLLLVLNFSAHLVVVFGQNKVHLFLFELLKKINTFLLTTVIF